MLIVKKSHSVLVMSFKHKTNQSRNKEVKNQCFMSNMCDVLASMMLTALELIPCDRRSLQLLSSDFFPWDAKINAVECSGIFGLGSVLCFSSTLEAYLLFTRTFKQHKSNPSCWRFRRKEKKEGGLCGISRTQELYKIHEEK